jgi:hypothetical protein
MRRLLVVVMMVLASACASLPRMAETPNVTPIVDAEHMAKYASWYSEVEKCSGLQGDFQALNFYTTTDHLHLNRTFDGYWEPGSIVVRHVWEEEAVKHEMMHDLLHTNKHPREFFQDKCGDLMRGEQAD